MQQIPALTPSPETGFAEAVVTVEGEALPLLPVSAPRNEPAYDGPVEIPEFLGTQPSSPTAQDQVVLEEFMGSILGVPARRPPRPPQVRHNRRPRCTCRSRSPPSSDGSKSRSRRDLCPCRLSKMSWDPPFSPVEEPASKTLAPVMPEDESIAPAIPEPAVAEPVGEIPVIAPRQPETPPQMTSNVVVPEPEIPAAPIHESETAAEPIAQEAVVSPDLVKDAPTAPPTGDFAADLMALGLGEMPAKDASEPTVERPAPEAIAPEQTPDEPCFTEPIELKIGTETGDIEAEEVAWLGEPVTDEVVIEAIDVTGPQTNEFSEQAEAMVEDSAPAMDFSGLIMSLDVTEDEELPVREPAGVNPSDLEQEDLIGEEPEEPEGGVISTDAYLSDISMSDLSFTGWAER